MKRQFVHDEREMMQSRKVLCEAYTILMLALIVSVFIQQFFFKAPFRQYAVEFFCFIGISLYVLVRNLILGINIFNGKSRWKKMPLVSSLIMGLSAAAINGIMAGGESPREFAIVLATTFMWAAGSSFAMLSFLNYINNKKQRRIEKSLDDEEQDG